MTNNKNNNYDTSIKVELWIIRLQLLFIRIFRFNIIASIFIFFIPITVSGFAINLYYEYMIFSRGVTIVLLWIAIAPISIHNVFNLVDSFFRSHKHLFTDKEEWRELYRNEMKRLQSSKYIIFGIPWALSITAVIFLVKFSSAPLAVQIWVCLSFFIVFFVSSIGFYGIYVYITIIEKICNSKIVFNPYHPDNFGGVADFGGFSTKGAIYFSSGALIFPLVFELLSMLSNGSEILIFTVLFLTGLFLVVMIASFLYPILKIKRFVDKEKERIILKSWEELRTMFDEFKQKKELDIKQGLVIVMHYYFNHKKLQSLKDYPWDFKVLLQFSSSFILPIAIALLQMLNK